MIHSDIQWDIMGFNDMIWYVNMVHIDMQWMFDHLQLAGRSTRRPRRRRSSAAHIHHGTWLKFTFWYQYVISRVISWMFVIIPVQKTHHNIFMQTHDFRNLLRWAAEIWWNLPISKTTMESHESFSRRSKATPKRCREMAVRCDWHIASPCFKQMFFFEVWGQPV